MRDPERISRVLDEIQALWNKYPDLRLMQLLLNVVREPAAYHIEDDQLIERLKALYAQEEQRDTTRAV